jgi:kumamolisin
MASIEARHELTNSIHHVPHGSTAMRATNPREWLELTVGVRRSKALPDLASLDDVLPGKRKYMQRDTLRDSFGSDPAAVAKIEAFAKAHNLVVTKDDRISARIGLAGTVADLSEAFGVRLLDYTNPDFGAFHARTGAVSVPADLASAITGVFGFNNHRILRRKKRLVDTRPVTLADANPARQWFLPQEVGAIYNFPKADASKQCVGLLEFGGGVEPKDIAAYFTKIKLPAPTVTVVTLDGATGDPASDPQSTGEVMLDVEVAGALAGGAKVAVYFSTFDEKGLVDCLGKVTSDAENDPSVVSISWGWDENQPMNGRVLWSTAAIEHVNESFLALAHLGVTVCVSTGDDGSEAQVKDGHAHVNFPATSPYVLAVGGTTLHVRSSALGRKAITEVVWNSGPGDGTGGGISDVTPVPAWQKKVAPRSINAGHFAGRAIPDVAANADPATGYFVMSGGQFGVVGGTSASAPLWASLIARINATLGSRVGNFNALLYSKIGPKEVLRDITKGNNDTGGLLEGQFAAKPGWDPCTGWGTPDGAKLVAALK